MSLTEDQWDEVSTHVWVGCMVVPWIVGGIILSPVLLSTWLIGKIVHYLFVRQETKPEEQNNGLSRHS